MLRRVSAPRAATLAALPMLLVATLPTSRGGSQSADLAELVSEALAIRVETRAAAEYERAADAYRTSLERLAAIDRGSLSLDDQVDHDLLEAHLRTRLFEIEDLELFRVSPASYFALARTSALFLRPGAIPDTGVRAAVQELRRLPGILRARADTRRPSVRLLHRHTAGGATRRRGSRQPNPGLQPLLDARDLVPRVARPQRR